MKVLWHVYSARPSGDTTHDGRVAIASGPSYRIVQAPDTFTLFWLPQNAKNLGSFPNAEAARDAAQYHYNEWEAFGVVWHARNHYGPSPLDEETMEAYHYFQSGRHCALPKTP